MPTLTPTLTQRVFIAGYYGFGNAGDEAILATMVRHLRELRPGLTITATSNTPAETAAAYGIDSILWTDVSAMLEAVRSAHLVLVGGGGIFHDYWGFNPNALLTDDHSGISFYTGPVLLGAVLRKPVMLYGVGIGPLLSEHGRRYTRIACEVAQRVTVRDQGSYELLAELGVPEGKAELTADPVFDFEVPEAERPPKPRVGVALRNWNLGIDPAFWEAEAARAFDLFLDAHDVELRFLPFQKLPTSLEDDAATARRVQSRMRQQARTSLFEESAAPEELAREIAACDLVIGMRLHAAILAAAAGVPCLSLSYDPKVEQAMERLSLGTYTVDIKAIEASSLTAAMGRAYERRDELRQQIARERPKLAADARRNAAIALEVLDAGEAGRLTPEAFEALSRSYQTHLESSHRLRVENQRLFGEFEFYQKRSLAEQERADALAAELENAGVTGDELVDRIGALEIARAEHEQHVTLLNRNFELEKKELERHQAELQAQLSGQIRSLEERLGSIQERLSQAETLRARMVRGLDQFHQTLTTNLETYRSQRAWRWMLWLRKAYWLNANRGLGATLGWMLRGSPDLEDLELAFPQVWSYMPERLEVPLLEGVSPQAPNAPSALVEPSPSQPVRLAEWLRPARYDVIILAIFDFEFRFQRPQQIAAELARRGHRVFWVSPARVLDPSSSQPFEAIPLRDNLWEIHLRGRKPELYTGAEPPDPALLDSLRALYRDFAIAGSCAVLQFPHWRQLGLGLRSEFGARLVYDCMDDWQNWTAEPRISEFNLAEERALSRDADVLVVTSQEFLERQEAAGLKPVLARNAADFDFFASPRPNDLLSDVPKPIVGYYGAIADWFDRDLVTFLAESRPQYSFVLIGGVHKVDVSRLEALPNVRFYGEKNYREIPLYLSHFDVALIPFVLNKLTKGVDPVKMYEYFSQGKPVVATDMAELAQSTDLLYIGRTREEFLQHVDAAIQEEDPGRAEARKRYAASNTWAARVDRIQQALDASFPLVSVLIVSYNSAEFLVPCLDSVLNDASWPNVEVILVDNGSKDNTRELAQRYLAERPSDRIKFLTPDRNLGFAGGNNLAAQEARGEYLVLLNADTIVPPGWLARLIRPCLRDATIGAVAAVTNFSGNETKINIDYQGVAEMLIFAECLAREKAGEVRDIAMAPLYCVLVPRLVWEHVGELDTGFEIGMFEDDDFTLRVREAGYRVVSAEDAFIHHFGNGSFAQLPSEESLRIFERNRKRFESKWQLTWEKHKLRPGVRPPYEELRLTPREFLLVEQGAVVKPTRTASPATLVRLHPPSCLASRGFNVQPDGRSALVVDCEGATPATVILWNGQMLETAYGGRQLLSALVPAELHAEAGVAHIKLVNDFGESNVLEFVVSRSSEAAG